MFLVDGAVCGTGVEVITLLPPVLFDHDQNVLTASGEVAMHDVLARVMEAPEDARIVVDQVSVIALLVVGKARARGWSWQRPQLGATRIRSRGLGPKP